MKLQHGTAMRPAPVSQQIVSHTRLTNQSIIPSACSHDSHCKHLAQTYFSAHATRRTSSAWTCSHSHQCLHDQLISPVKQLMTQSVHQFATRFIGCWALGPELYSQTLAPPQRFTCSVQAVAESPFRSALFRSSKFCLRIIHTWQNIAIMFTCAQDAAGARSFVATE